MYNVYYNLKIVYTNVINNRRTVLLRIVVTKASNRAQTALAVIGNIAFPSGRNKGKIISFTFTGDEFTRSPPVAPRLPSSNVRNVFPRLLQTARIELMFGGV